MSAFPKPHFGNEETRKCGSCDVFPRLCRIAGAPILKSMDYIKIDNRLINVNHIAQLIRQEDGVALYLTACGPTMIVHQLSGPQAVKIWDFLSGDAKNFDRV